MILQFHNITSWRKTIESWRKKSLPKRTGNYFYILRTSKDWWRWLVPNKSISFETLLMFLQYSHLAKICFQRSPHFSVHKYTIIITIMIIIIIIIIIFLLHTTKTSILHWLSLWHYAVLFLIFFFFISFFLSFFILKVAPVNVQENLYWFPRRKIGGNENFIRKSISAKGQENVEKKWLNHLNVPLSANIEFAATPNIVWEGGGGGSLLALVHFERFNNNGGSNDAITDPLCGQFSNAVCSVHVFVKNCPRSFFF